MAARLKDAEARRINSKLIAETEGTLGAEHVFHSKRARGVYHLGRAAVLDRKFRHRLKWFACALAAPFGRSSFEAVYSSSISSAVKNPFRRGVI